MIFGFSFEKFLSISINLVKNSAAVIPAEDDCQYLPKIKLAQVVHIAIAKHLFLYSTCLRSEISVIELIFK